MINLLDQSITMGILQNTWGLTEPEAAGLYGTYSYAGICLPFRRRLSIP